MWKSVVICDPHLGPISYKPALVSSAFWGIINGSFGNLCLVSRLQQRILKTMDTIGNCRRPVFSLGVSQHMHNITNLWKFELNRSSKLRDINERKKHPCHTKLFAFWCLISRPQILNLRSQNQIRGKLLLSRKLRHFRVSCFSQCFILSTSPRYS